jgi:hypothetical protein
VEIEENISEEIILEMEKIRVQNVHECQEGLEITLTMSTNSKGVVVREIQ